MIHTRVIRRVNKNQSITYYARWAGGCQRLLRTEPKPNINARKKWENEAARRCLDVQDQLNGRNGQTRVIPMYLWVAFRKWAESIEPGLAEASHDRSTGIVHDFLDWLTKPKHGRHKVEWVDGVCESHVTHYKGYRLNRGIKPATWNMELRVLRQFFAWCLEIEVAAKDPTRRARPFKLRGRGQPNIIPDALVRQMIREGDNVLAQATIFVLAETGMRRGELIGLGVADWHRESTILQIPAGRSETTKKHGRSLPVGREAAKWLDAVITLRAFASPILFASEGGRRLTSQLGLWLGRYDYLDKHLTPHDMRRWCYTTLHRLGCPEAVIKTIVGHQLDGVQSAYLGAVPLETIRGWLQCLDDVLVGEKLVVPGPVVTVSEDLIMPREEVQETSLQAPSGVELTWNETTDEQPEPQDDEEEL